MIRRSGILLAAVGLLFSVVAIALLIGDSQEFWDAWDHLRWQYLAWLAPLAILNHAIRYWRWEVLLKHVSVVDLKRSTAALLFSAGSLLIFTPGRVGEIAKCIYVRDFFGIPISKSLPVLIAERVADVLVMALLASLGLLLLGETPSLLIGGGIVLAITLIVAIRTSILSHIARWKVPSFMKSRGYGELLNQANAAQISLFTRKMLLSNFVRGTSAWMIEVSIFFFSLSAAGTEPTSHLFVLALALFPLASLAGSFSFLPGGLGVTEGSLMALGVLLGGLPVETVILAALLSRTAILGVVIFAGIVSLLLLYHMPRPQ